MCRFENHNKNHVIRKCSTPPSCLNTLAYSFPCSVSLRLLSSRSYLPRLSAAESAGSAPHATALWLTVKEVIL